MLSRTLAFMTLLGGSMALPRSFVLNLGGIDGALEPSPVQLLNATDQAFNWPTKLHTAFPTTTSSAREDTAVSNSSVTVTANRTAFTSCLPTTTITITLPNPTPTPKIDTSRSDETDTLTDTEDASPFDTSAPEPLSNGPHWFTAATFSLVFYDILTMGIFLWLWVCGYLWWFRRGSDMDRTARRRRGVVDVEMARIQVRRYERDWARSARGNASVRTESEQRARSAREAELEAEMRRLGMI